MPNSFTVVPNILPGNVTIGGNLTVSGDQLRIGAAAPFIRVGKDVSQVAVLTYNLGFDGVTFDTGADGAQQTGLNVQGTAASFTRINPAGGKQTAASQYAIFTNYTSHSHTGDTTLDTIISKVIPANTLGANGGISVVCRITSSAQGATPTSLVIALGASIVASINITATGTYLLEAFFGNRNLTNNQLTWGRLTNLGTGAVLGASGTLAVDTTVDQTLAMQISNGTSTDTQTLDSLVARQENSFGPV